MLRLLRGYGASASLRKLLLVASLAALASFAGPAVADTPTVVALGDSLTAGYGLPTEDGFVPRLQRWLTDHGTAAVLVNAGVSGDTTAGGLARTDWTLTPDVGGLIVTLGGNDLLRGLAPEEARANLDAILAKAQARKLPVLLIGLVAPGNYGPAYKAAFDAIYPDLAAKYATLYVRNFLAPIADKPDRALALKTLMQADGIHPNAKGVALIVEALGPEVQELVRRAR